MTQTLLCALLKRVLKTVCVAVDQALNTKLTALFIYMYCVCQTDVDTD